MSGGTPMSTQDRLMTLQECADYLGFTAAGLYQMRYNGTAPLGYKVGGKVRYRRSELDAWLEAQRDAPREATVA